MRYVVWQSPRIPAQKALLIVNSIEISTNGKEVVWDWE